jgi:undecaprenyl-diphosphatase
MNRRAAEAPEPELSPQGRQTVAEVRQALEDALRSIDNPEQADRIIDQVLSSIEDIEVQEVREAEGEVSKEEAAASINLARRDPRLQKLEATLIEAARQIARGEGETRAALEEAVQEAVNPEQRGIEKRATAEPRDWLLRSVIKRMGPIQKLDARVFLAINKLPHTSTTNRAMVKITSLMNGGSGWVGLLILAALLDPERGRRALRDSLPPLWLATMAVEYPVKHYFRRRRPFVDVVQAISVGRKPGTFSFPSGHSAAAFAGAYLLRQHYPRLAGLWYSFAMLIGFSRVYLGVHYPGDVMSGAFSGTVIAAATNWMMQRSEKS